MQLLKGATLVGDGWASLDHAPGLNWLRNCNSARKTATRSRRLELCSPGTALPRNAQRRQRLIVQVTGRRKAVCFLELPQCAFGARTPSSIHCAGVVPLLVQRLLNRTNDGRVVACVTHACARTNRLDAPRADRFIAARLPGTLMVSSVPTDARANESADRSADSGAHDPTTSCSDGRSLFGSIHLAPCRATCAYRNERDRARSANNLERFHCCPPLFRSTGKYNTSRSGACLSDV